LETISSLKHLGILIKNWVKGFDPFNGDLFDVRSNYNTVLSNDFVTNLWEKLSKNGLIAINYVLEDQKKLINTLVILRKIFAVTAIIDIEDHANIVILACKANKPNVESIKPYIKKLECTYDLGFTKTLESIQWLPQPSL
jgi:hypothetical protein